MLLLQKSYSKLSLSTIEKLLSKSTELKPVTIMGVCLSLGDCLGNREAPFSPVLPEFLPKFRHSEECFNKSAQEKQQLWVKKSNLKHIDLVHSCDLTSSRRILTWSWQIKRCWQGGCFLQKRYSHSVNEIKFRCIIEIVNYASDHMAFMLKLTFYVVQLGYVG